jgi:uncharacterized membrane protein HdeD (DUF308 family)
MSDLYNKNENKEKKMSEQNELPGAGLAEGIKGNAGLTIVSGVILLIAGMFSIASPLVAGLSITIMVGAMLAVSGIGQCFLAFRTGAFSRGLMVLIVGVLMTITGFYLMQQPVSGLKTLTIILMSYLLATGVLEIIVAFQLKPVDGWGLLLFNGFVTLVLGILLWRQFPLSGAWAIGVLFGIKMIFSGWAFIFLGRNVKKMSVETQTA